jgi:D-glycero-D-manno-heptose 1,7-bisphosphate phosphatase
VNERVLALLAREGVTIDEIFICPHRPEERCVCRKPGTGMLERAARTFGAAPAQSFVIGDKLCDMEMGHRAGATTLLVRTGWGRETEGQPEARPQYVAADLLDAARVIVSQGPSAQPASLAR